MTRDEMRTAVLAELIRKSGVREWENDTAREGITRAAVQIADFLLLAPNSAWSPTQESGGPASGTGLPSMTTRKILLPEQDGTPKQIAFWTPTGTFTAANDLRNTTSGNRTDVALTLNALANTTPARQSAKADLGAVRAPLYAVLAALSWQATPTIGNTLELWWAPSISGTAANCNVASCSGSDANYTGYSSNIAQSLVQAMFLGEFVLGTTGTGIQMARIGTFQPPERYGSLIVWNKGGSALTASNNEMHIVFDPIMPQGQSEV